MPDKHEVGGSSPLGPTSRFSCKIKVKKLPTQKTNGGVAQLGEHLPCKQGVMGSNPIISTTDTKVSERKTGAGKLREFLGIRSRSGTE